MKVFAWLLLINRILTIDNLNRRGWCLVNRCVMCKNDSETTKHLFNDCCTARTLYNRVSTLLDVRLPRISDIINMDAISALTNKRYTRKERSILLIPQFVLWRERYCRIFRDSEKDIEDLVDQVQTQWSYSMLVQRV